MLGRSPCPCPLARQRQHRARSQVPPPEPPICGPCAPSVVSISLLLARRHPPRQLARHTTPSLICFHSSFHDYASIGVSRTHIADPLYIHFTRGLRCQARRQAYLGIVTLHKNTTTNPGDSETGSDFSNNRTRQQYKNNRIGP